MTDHTQIYARLPEALLPWYNANKRDLPWRKNSDPYRIWLSEIMLQQTRVEAVKGYFQRFLEALPSVAALAECDDELLYKLWEGLGYYNRVRNLRKAARIIMTEYGGIFPSEYNQVLALPGIGDYTAGAICSVSFQQKTPAVDGNVLRVISRLTEDDTPIDLPAYKTSVREKLAAIYPVEAGDFTQALMELGATVCGPNWKPRCTECPCRQFCKSAAHGTTENYPVRLPKKKRKIEKKTVFILSCNGSYALEKRPDSGLLAGLWQFPNIEGIMELPEILRYLEDRGIAPRDVLRQVERKHIFTHIQWEMRGIYIEVANPAGPYHWMTETQINEETALPTAFRQFWEELNHV